MFENLQNPMAYIIGFQMAVLLVPAFVALAKYLRDEQRGAGYGVDMDATTRARPADIIYLGESPRELPKAA